MPEAEKDLSQAQSRDPLYRLRHSAVHVLALAAKEFDPKVKLAIGPPIENGFYYDFEFSRPVGEENLPELEKTMAKIVAADYPIKKKVVKRGEALKKETAARQPYKVELIEDLPDKEVSYYGINGFWDLCRGPHLDSTGQLKAFKLLSVAGAYWRGSEHNPMLTRIYGTAFTGQKSLKAYLSGLEEAKKRDHKKLGPQLDLFVFSDLVGPGLPLWTPKGTIMRQILDDFVWRLRQAAGYQRVEIPHLTKKDLYERSGHWEKFKDELFKISTREGHMLALKPMNCPHHTQIFARRLWSYRELPQRYANTTMVYRDEQSGELAGLSRVLSITQDDAHVFCRPDQVEGELLAIWEIVERFYQAAGFKLQVRLSLRDPETPERYLGPPEQWKQSESTLAKVAKQKRARPTIGLGEAVFYGPKIDFLAQDSLDRQWQLATIQLDLNLPSRFDLTYVNQEGKREPVVMIHAAIMGSIERYISILIEHFGGDFPVWLAPVQAVVLPVSDKYLDYAREITDACKAAGLRVELSDERETLGKKIWLAESQKIPYLLIIGEQESRSRTVAVRSRLEVSQRVVGLDKFLAEFKDQAAGFTGG